METVKKRRDYYGLLFGISLCISTVVLLFQIINPKIQVWFILSIGILGNGYLIFLWIRENNKVKMARLITENKILQISSAVISSRKNSEIASEKLKGIEILVSYFGILLASEIILFNQENIRLRAVEFQKEFISITYGTNQWIENIRLMCSMTDQDEIKRISERFEYETGIKPTILK